MKTLQRWLKIFCLSVIVLMIAIALSLTNTNSALAAKNLAKQPVTEINISLGNSDGALKFFPSDLQFQSGKRYKLILNNSSPQKHYFTAKDFADAIWSQKVDAGNVEVKGAIHELELRPNTQAEWVFVPIKSGTYGLRCTIPGHAEAGMVGSIQITG